MSDLKRLGFFHFGDDEKSDPIGSLEATIEERSKSESGMEDTLLVLPEAFNVRGGYYSNKPELDERAIPRLRAISAERGIVFVAGIIDEIGSSNSAYLIDGPAIQKLLTRKRARGWPLYTPCEVGKDRFVPCRGVGITALICDDAAYAHGECLEQMVLRVKKLKMKHSLLCIPAYMRPTPALCVARRLGNSISVVLANGDKEQHSAIVYGGQERIPDRLDQNEIQLCDLEPEAGPGGASSQP